MAIRRVSAVSANTIFLACNFSNKRVKSHFDKLKRDWEDALPVRVYLSDQITGGGARDLWREITSVIREANLTIFDVTSFRPNVILELGFALSAKQASQVVICRDLTPGGRTSPEQRAWLMSDISHLHRIEYKSFATLDKRLLPHLDRMAPVKNFYKLIDELKRVWPGSINRYVAETSGILSALRDNGPLSRREFKCWLEDRSVDAEKVGKLLVRFKLAIPSKGRNGVWELID